jgi:hypothetical protein
VAATKNAAKKTMKGKKPTVAKPAKATKAAKPANEVTLERRASADRRSPTDRRQHQQPVAVERRALQRREKVVRRRQIDPTTCERDYSDEEVEFMNALDNYKRRSGRMFPTCSEVLEVLRGLGYEKRMASALPAVDLVSDEPAQSISA